VSPEPANPGQCGSFNDLPTFRMLPVAGVVSVGDEATGTLTSSDRVDDTGSHIQAWELRGDANQNVTVDLISDDFDAMLYLMGPGLSGALSNDDGGGGCHARITTILPESGTYRIIASSLSSEGTGAFTLRVSAEPGAVSEQECGRPDDAEFQPLADLPIDDRILQLGDELQGELTVDDVRYRDGSFVQAWGLEVVRGGSYTIDLRSEDFDSFLFVLGSGIAEILTDDDSGGGCHSRVTFQPSASGMIRVVASSIGAGRTGAFRLRVADVEGPVESAPCQTREI